MHTAFALISIFLMGCAGSDTAANLNACADDSVPMKAIAACSALIQSGHVAGQELGGMLVNRAVAYLDTGKPDRASLDLDQALALLSAKTRAYELRGVTHGIRGEMDAAFADFTASIEADPTNASALTYRGKVLVDTGEPARAIVDYSRALQLQPDNPDALNGRCWSRAVLNIDLDAALTDCNAAIEAGGREPANNFNSRGLVYFRRGNFREAIASYDAALRLDSRVASSYYVRGLCKRVLGEPSADADIDQALKREPGVRERYAGFGVK